MSSGPSPVSSSATGRASRGTPRPTPGSGPSGASGTTSGSGSCGRRPSPCSTAGSQRSSGWRRPPIRRGTGSMRRVPLHPCPSSTPSRWPSWASNRAGPKRRSTRHWPCWPGCQATPYSEPCWRAPGWTSATPKGRSGSSTSPLTPFVFRRRHTPTWPKSPLPSAMPSSPRSSMTGSARTPVWPSRPARPRTVRGRSTGTSGSWRSPAPTGAAPRSTSEWPCGWTRACARRPSSPVAGTGTGACWSTGEIPPTSGEPAISSPRRSILRNAWAWPRWRATPGKILERT